MIAEQMASRRGNPSRQEGLYFCQAAKLTHYRMPEAIPERESA
jgi:hypothetical protein